MVLNSYIKRNLKNIKEGYSTWFKVGSVMKLVYIGDWAYNYWINTGRIIDGFK